MSNAGIASNRVLTDSPFGTYDPVLAGGPSALHRFQRDALSVPGVCTIIIFEGTNDIGLPLLGEPTPPFPVTADDLIAGYRQLIAQAHASGLRILGATITPSTLLLYSDPLGVHKAVNQWMLTSGEWDGVLDFSAVVSDPNNPDKLLPAYDGGDGLHLSMAGYEALANSINLASLHCPN